MNDELATLALAFARGRYRAAVHLSKPAHQGQADAQAALGAVERTVHLGEEVKHLGQHLRGDAYTCVPNPDHGPIAPFNLQGDSSPVWGVLRGIVEQVP